MRVYLLIIFNISKLSISKKLNDISTARFELPILDVNSTYENFQEFNKIKISLLEDNIETALFSGIMRD